MARPLGQYFLRDPAILERIVAALDPAPTDVVIEIGPGEGTLTRHLASKVGAVVAIEKDRGLAAQLQAGGRDGERGAPLPSNVTVVPEDALTIDWQTVLPATTAYTTCKVAGNIPYYITTPLIDRALSPPLPQVVVFLVQKEVADRVVAASGSKAYGALSVGVQSVARAERLFLVRAGAFHPRPAVDSAVLRMTPRENPLVATSERVGFRGFVTALFGQRRKQLVRSLRDVEKISRERATALLVACNIEPTGRAEQVDPAGLVALYRAAVAARS